MAEFQVLRCYVSGRVQGVYFRASTREKALALGVGGYARNLEDGRVEVLAAGPDTAVNVLIEWLWIGPPASRVERVDVEAIVAADAADLISQDFRVC
jgi:acylphosphatase